MFSIAANLVAVPSIIARSLSVASAHHGSCLNAVQGRNLSKLIAFPIWTPAFRGHCSLLGRVRPFSSLASEATLNIIPIQKVVLPTEKIVLPTAVEIDPIHYSSAARKEAREGNFEKAEKYYTLAIQEEEQEAKRYPKRYLRVALMKAFRGDFYREFGQFSKAIKDLREAIQQSPRPDSSYFRDLACTYRGMGEISKAIEVLREGIEYIPCYSADLHYDLGEIYLSTGNTKLALEHLEQVVKMCDTRPSLAFEPMLSEFLPDIKTTVLQLKNCTGDEAPEIYAKLLKARTRFPGYPFYSG
jgi:tetratricopeptide (TPR) repeat protein